MQGLINLFKNNVRGDDIAGLAAACGGSMDAETLGKTLGRYNADAARGRDLEFGKAPQYLRPLSGEGGYYAVKMDITGNRWWPTPCMTLGGLQVDGASGMVLRDGDGSSGGGSVGGEPIKGLYAAGKTAVGIASNYYVSGLSLADCVFAGRRAGRHASSS
jgi:3-oxo-5alpha-steroid 4-dehydrogenase